MAEPLTKFERAVLVALLECDPPLPNQLRKQLHSCTVTERELTGCGFFTTLQVRSEFQTQPGLTFIFGDVDAEIAGLTNGAGSQLYVKDGLLEMLEGYCHGEAWPDTIETFALHCDTEGRNLETLVRKASSR